MPQQTQAAGCHGTVTPIEMYLLSLRTMMEWSPMAPALGLRWRLGELAGLSAAAAGIPVAPPAADDREMPVSVETVEASVAPVLELVEDVAEATGLVAAAPVAEPVLEDEPPAGEVETGSDDLTRVTGIGPATAQALKDAGVTTFAQMGALTPDYLVDLRRKIGPGVSEDLARKQIEEAASLVS